MAKVKITGHASGTGVLTVTAPNTDTDRTITLPDGDVTLGAATPSITDGGNATAITIDASENVGIGGSPTNKLHIRNSGATQRGDLRLGDAGGTTYWDIGRDNASTGDFTIFNQTDEKLRILSSGGITFNGDTAAANALDDYEEGTWTPAITAGAVAYTSQIGRYTKIGNKVFIDAFIQISSITTASSYVIATGLPFGSAGSHYPSLASKTNGFNWGGSATMITFQVVPNTTTIAAAGSHNNGTFNDINANGLLANDWIQFSGSYTVA